MTDTQPADKQLSWPKPATITQPRWPAWVRELVGPFPLTTVPDQPHGLIIRAGEAGRFALVEVAGAGAYMMDGPAFRQHTRAAYMALARVLGRLSARRALRFWNYVPFIHTPATGIAPQVTSPTGLPPADAPSTPLRYTPSQDRYMAFNAGRYEAFCAWFGGPGGFAQLLPTATAVGHFGSDLLIHVLACTDAGTPLENPRQRPSYSYSPNYGPLPPCFSRAVVLGPEAGLGLGACGLNNGRADASTPKPQAFSLKPQAIPLILVGGTASVYGEDTVHTGDARRQTQETMENLGVLVRTACAGDPATGHRAWLGRFRELRVYIPHPQDEPAILAVLRDHFSPAVRVEILPADLCRSDLRVEISGLAIGGSPNHPAGPAIPGD